LCAERCHAEVLDVVYSEMAVVDRGEANEQAINPLLVVASVWVLSTD
jgi:hypothetical protein